MKIPKIAIIGAGAVGSHVAYAIMLKEMHVNIILIDKNEDFEQGQVWDLKDSMLYSGSTVEKGDLKDAGNADIIIITAGANQKPQESRLELVEKNTEILRSIKRGIGEIKKDAIVILVSNPVDILTYIASKEWGLEKGRVFGTGTILDSARLRWRLAEKTEMHPSSVHGWVLGEHGQSAFIAWTTVKLGGITAGENHFPGNIKNMIAEEVKKEAFEIIARKGATFFGIGVCTAEVVAAILGDSGKVFPLSVPLNGEFGLKNISLGLPAILGINGVESVVEIPLNEDENKALINSADSLRRVITRS